MEYVRESGEDEMLLEFLRAEYSSPRFDRDVLQAAREYDIESLVCRADLADPAQNAARRSILASYRGYGKNKELFEDFPEHIRWRVTRFDELDLARAKFIDYSFWNELTSGSRRAADCVPVILSGKKVFGQPNDYFFKIAGRFAAGERPPMLIFLSSGPEITVVEGHARLAGIMLWRHASHHISNLDAIIGICPRDEYLLWD